MFDFQKVTEKIAQEKIKDNTFLIRKEEYTVVRERKILEYAGLKTCKELYEYLTCIVQTEGALELPRKIIVTKEQLKHLKDNPNDWPECYIRFEKIGELALEIEFFRLCGESYILVEERGEV